MAISTNSYGSVEEVAALARRYTDNGSFATTTNPSLTQVEQFIDRTSSTINVILAGSGFQIPITQTDAKAAIAAIVIEAVVDLCHAANSAGRFFTERALERGIAPMKVIRQEMADWVADNAAGLAAMGAARVTPDAGQVAFRDTDESGDEIHPIFQRDAYGNSFKDWDKDR